jgi:hypothetical protein
VKIIIVEAIAMIARDIFASVSYRIFTLGKNIDDFRSGERTHQIILKFDEVVGVWFDELA